MDASRREQRLHCSAIGITGLQPMHGKRAEKGRRRVRDTANETLRSVVCRCDRDVRVVEAKREAL